jgi:6-phosphogluconolactonase
MPEKIVNVYRDMTDVAVNTASKLVEKLIALQKLKPELHLMLTGGTVGIATLLAIRENQLRSSVNFRNIHFWWGDERFLNSNHNDRNALQARIALLNFLDLDPKKIHEFPSSDNGLKLEVATKQFSAKVNSIGPSFDLVLLGMGSDGHVASLFPDRPTPASGVMVLAEHHSPKPPAERITFTYEAINSAAEVWIVVAGNDKREAVSIGLGDNAGSLPVGRVNGIEKTQWFLDESAGALAFDR